MSARASSALMATVGSGLGPRPEMLRAIRRLREHGLRIGALTNNWPSAGGATESAPHAFDALDCFDAIVESAKVGLRKPDPRIYELVCSELGVDPSDAIFLDDLGVNLKPARAMGMATIKVITSEQALAELAALVQLDLG
jgi:putative hydrolase of the HAD superfamily